MEDKKVELSEVVVEDKKVELSEFVDRIRGSNPRLLSGLDDKQASLLVHRVLAIVSEEIDGLDEGVLRFPAIGKITLRKGEHKRGSEVFRVKRVVLRPRPIDE
ncbi:hypothetical protein FWJ25_04655 [Marinobacter salinexigens]|uniref:DNA-binding protein n=1 Tax=Marinobacter salinexigens TaxID=2919747 RepID=A0A5B0VKP8_9GAMM|nr:hypothetical protein [Marinobacter salinexigens]KAA1174685.1 hypothetical protein FWJ25_04655 [Marinobacter salinexigens]